MFSCLDTIQECDEQTDGHRPTDSTMLTHSVAWKNGNMHAVSCDGRTEPGVFTT